MRRDGVLVKDARVRSEACDQMGEPPLWLVVGVLVAMFLVNVYSYPAWQHRRIGNW